MSLSYQGLTGVPYTAMGPGANVLRAPCPAAEHQIHEPDFVDFRQVGMFNPFAVRLGGRHDPIDIQQQPPKRASENSISLK
jgi:hypothetical protein